MKTFWVTSCLLLASCSSILCSSCSKSSYGQYDSTSSQEAIRNEVPIYLWNMSRIDLRSFEGNPCPELYKRYSTEHTHCKKSTCNTISKGVSEEDKKIILEVHNSLRSKLASGKEKRYRQLPSAANMMEMEWDDELAQLAQDHANLCRFLHDKDAERNVENFPVGQNLQSSTGKKNWGDIENWYKEEVCFFFPAFIKPYHPDKIYGHFTQVTWAETWKIGCGYAAYNKDGATKSLFTCNYGPGGNMLRGTHYIVGEPCSQCPKNTECSKQYPGLCKSKTRDGPQTERPPMEDYILYCDFSKDDSKECSSVKVTGSRSFETRHIYSGDYKTVVLQGGESITIDLGKASNTNGICPFLYTRFGPNNANDPDNESSLEISFYTPNGNPMSLPMQPILKMYRNSFHLRGMHMGVGDELKTTFTLKVRQGAASQFFDVKAWGIRKGPC